MSLSFEGIGAVLQNEDEYVKVVRIVPAGPASQTSSRQNLLSVWVKVKMAL